MILLVPVLLLAHVSHGRATKREEEKEGPAVDEPIDTGFLILFVLILLLI